MENEFGIMEINVGRNGEFDEETNKFILEKIQEAIDEDIWYTEEESEKWFDEQIAKLKNDEFDEEMKDALDELEMENRNVYNKTFKKI